MKITEEQLKILEKFSCERLSYNAENKELLKNFKSENGEQLVAYLNQTAWEEDKSGAIAFYLVKDPNNQVVMFFSLKCGSLFDPLDEEEIKANICNMQKILKLKDNDEKLFALQLLKLDKYLDSNNISCTATDYIKQVLNHSKSELKLLIDDREREKNKKIIQVSQTYPGIELVHFCTNDNAKISWKKYSFNHPMGEVLFWKFIAPIIYETQNQIGCQYAFLFAADISNDGSLINYYNVSLKFKQLNNVGTSKPRYDFCCDFMCQEINDLRKNRQEYFDNFNPDDNDIIA